MSTPARAMDSIEVHMDNARLLKVPEGTDTIVVGNPLIADVTIQRNQVMVVTGKNFGTTNMIALDGKGAIISESQIIVSTPHKDRLTVVRGFDLETYACNPNCGPVMQIGDSDRHFGRAGAQSRDRSQTATSGAGAAPGR
ncbi:MAG TPA: pilus assembly protein N-terminal domain-containing protein [Beijerinckiaceae bacterium]|nr:pilus assembly protein N-terminal domain-containing protein [Beijerinckiaceae bacterium]